MTDDELIRAFEQATLPKAAFTHRTHVRAAWSYLRAAPFHDAVARFATALQRYASSLGASAKYHETMTVAWMALVAERLAATPDLDWDGFAAAHVELFETPSLLASYYSGECLASERARQTFVLPDRQPSSVR